DVVAARILREELIGVFEVHDDVQADLGVRLVEAVEHGHEGVVEALRVEGHLLGADADRLDAGLRERRQPRGDLRVLQHHRVAAGHQDLAQLLAPADRVAAAVGGDLGVEALDVADDVGDVRQALLGHRAVLALDLLAGDQFLAVAEAAVGRARGDHV
ncbi:MAG: hypothetical protein ACK559_01540, partial [bacterium]